MDVATPTMRTDAVRSPAPRTRVMFICSGRSDTGYGRVAEGLIGLLAQDHDVMHVARDVTTEHSQRRIAMRGNVDIADPLAVRAVEAALRSFMPEAVLVLDDPARTQRYLALCAVHAPSARAIAYLPVDGLIRNPSQFRAIAERALIVASTQCVAENIEGALGDLSHRLAPTIVPQPISLEAFRQISADGDRVLARREVIHRNLLVPGCALPERGFIVLNAARNQMRKRLDITMAAFASFSRDKPLDVRLWLHTALKSPVGWDIQTLARSYGITDRLLLTQGARSHPSVTIDDLNVIYNACDVGVNTAMGETWGMASFEHAATGAPQVLTALPVLKEIWPRGAVWAATVHRQRQGFNLDGCPPDTNAVSQGLETLYADHTLRRRMGNNARSNALEHANRNGAIRKYWAVLLKQSPLNSQGLVLGPEG